MIRPIKITLNAAHPEVPLIEATTFVGSPSAVFVSGVPATVGLWRITSVKVACHYPDDSATTVECVKGASGVWTATLPATATSGRVTHGFEILADGLDERGDAVTGYVLGYADFAVFTRDMTIDSGGTLYYMHYFDAVPQTPKKGDVAPDGSGGLQLYNGTEWVPMGGYTPPAGGIPKTDLASGVQASLDKADTALQSAPVTSINSKTGAVVLSASDVGALGNSGEQTLDGTLTVQNANLPDGAERLRAGDFGFDHNATISVHYGNDVYYIGVRDISGILALLTDIAVKSVKLNGTALTPDANGAVDVPALPIRGGTVEGKVYIAKRPFDVGEVFPLYSNQYGRMFRFCESNAGIKAIISGSDTNIDRFEFWGGYGDDQSVLSGPCSELTPDGSSVITAKKVASSFDSNTTYKPGDLVIYNDYSGIPASQSESLYFCTTEHTGAWNPAHFTSVDGLIQMALALKAPLASPAFTGTPTAPTPTAGDNSTKVATTAFVQAAVGAIKTFQHDAGGYYIEVEAS